MADEKKSTKDPINPEVLARLTEMDAQKQVLAQKLLELELEKVSLLGAARRIDVEFKETFAKVLEERGISPGTPVSIDSQTGVLRTAETPTEPQG